MNNYLKRQERQVFATFCINRQSADCWLPTVGQCRSVHLMYSLTHILGRALMPYKLTPKFAYQKS